jgi:prophage DNA circulation protein
MSWVEKIQTELIITTGDGKTYRPNWLNATKSKEYNISEFEFIEVPGTLVTRGTSIGRKFNIEIFFQGDDHLDQASAFEASCDDSRAWTVTHPFYGELIVQPVSLLFDNKDYNVSKVTGSVVETISDQNPKLTVNPADKIVLDKLTLDEIVGDAYVADLPTPDAANLNLVRINTSNVYNKGKKIASISLDVENYFNAFNEANAAIANAIQKPLEAIRKVQAMINAPIFFVNSVKNRVDNFISQFNTLRDTISNLFRRSDKKVFESQQVTVMSAMAQASVTNPDYSNRGDVLDVIENVVNTYNQFIEDVDSIQSENAGNPDAYVPDADSMTALSDLVNFTIANLFEIVIESRQERVYYLEEDSNVILLVQRFYGLDVDGTIIEEFIADNEIGLEEILIIRKGRRIVYYL